jgi:glucosylceramidase
MKPRTRSNHPAESRRSKSHFFDRTCPHAAALALLLGALSVSGAENEENKVRSGTGSVVCITSAPGGYWKPANCTVSTAEADVTVTNDASAQTWEGFGGTFNEMGWNYLSTKALRDEAIQLLFGEDGCRFTWGRIPMGASDYAMDRYTLDEVADDFAMEKFSIDRDRQKLIPFIKAAQAVRPELRFWASPWTPPTWMKEGPFVAKSKSNFDGGQMKGDEQIFKAYALYFVRFIEEYQKQGIKVEAVAPQNEPNYEQNYPSCHWGKERFTAFVPHLETALRKAGLNTKIMLGTMSNPGGDRDPAIIGHAMSDPTASGMFKILGVQYTVADRIASFRKYNLPIWVTEHRCGNYPKGTNAFMAPNDHAYGKESWRYIRGAIKAGATAYNAWNMVLDPVGYGIDTDRKWAQNSLLVVKDGKIILTPTYYVFRHCAQFVKPGAKILETSTTDTIAFRNPDGGIVVVLYASTGKGNYTVDISGKKFQFAMPDDGWATLVVR